MVNIRPAGKIAAKKVVAGGNTKKQAPKKIAVPKKRGPFGTDWTMGSGWVGGWVGGGYKMLVLTFVGTSHVIPFLWVALPMGWSRIVRGGWLNSLEN